MSQFVPKKIQIAQRQKRVSKLFLENIGITQIAELLNVDRKTIQRDLQQVKFSFGHSVPSEQAYNLSRHVLYEHGVIFELAIQLFNDAAKEDKLEYLKMIEKIWRAKAFFLAKIGVFGCIPPMLDENHDLYKDTLVISLKSVKKIKPKTNKFEEFRELLLKNKMLDKLAADGKFG